MSFHIDPRGYLSLPPDELEIIGHYSLKQNENGLKEYDPSLSLLKYYKPPPNCRNVYFDLNLAYEQTRRKIEIRGDRNLYTLYKWILRNFDEVYTRDSDGKWLQPDFICFRGLLTKLYSTLSQASEAWIMSAAKYDGVIYLAEVKTEEAIERKAMETDMDKRRCTWGFKFEQFVLAESPSKDPKPEEPLDESEEFCCVFKSTLGKHKMVYAAEMDGIISKEEVEDSLKGKNIKFVELKTNKFINTHQKLNSFKKYKSLKWWCQSYLVGIDTIICGFRDEKGVVKEIKNYSLDDISRMSRGIWDGEECRSFSNAFLEFVKANVTKDYNEGLYNFSWDPKKDPYFISMEEVDPNGNFKFLPEWYINDIKHSKNIVHK